MRASRGSVGVSVSPWQRFLASAPRRARVPRRVMERGGSDAPREPLLDAPSPSFSTPSWYSFPPYFTCVSCLQGCPRFPRDAPAALLRLQPVRETRERQMALWKEFVLDYCRANRVRRARGAGPSRVRADQLRARPARRCSSLTLRKTRRCSATPQYSVRGMDHALARKCTDVPRCATRQAARRRTTQSPGCACC